MQRAEVQWTHVYFLREGGLKKRRRGRSQQSDTMACGNLPAHEMERLPLAAAHFGSRVDVEDKHGYLRGLMFLALAYLTKLYSAAI